MRVTISIAVAMIMKSVPSAFGLEYLRSGSGATDLFHTNTTISRAVADTTTETRVIDEPGPIFEDGTCRELHQPCSSDNQCCTSPLSTSKDTYCFKIHARTDSDEKRCGECRGTFDCPTTATCENAGTAYAVCDPSSIETFPGIEKITRGYDPFKADPLRLALQDGKGVLSAEPDPGFRDAFLTLDFINGSPGDLGIGAVLNVPKGYNIHETTPICKKIEQTNVLQDAESVGTLIKSRIGAGASVSILGRKVEFAVGYGSTKEFKKNADQKKSVTSHISFCAQYSVKLQDENTEVALSEAAKNWLAQNFKGPSSYFSLFNKYGTHILTDATFGVAKGGSSIATESSVKELTSDNSEYEVTIALAFKGISGATNGSAERTAAEKIAKAGIKTTTWSAGNTNIIDNNNIERGKVPDILSITGLKSICDVLHDKNIEHFIKGDCDVALRDHCISVLGPSSALCMGESNSIECSADDECTKKYGANRPFCSKDHTCTSISRYEVCIGTNGYYTNSQHADNFDSLIYPLTMTARWGTISVETRHLSAGLKIEKLNCFPYFESDVNTMSNITIALGSPNDGEDYFEFDFVVLRQYSSKKWEKVWGVIDRDSHEYQTFQPKQWCIGQTSSSWISCEEEKTFHYTVGRVRGCYMNTDCEFDEVCDATNFCNRDVGPMELCVSTNGYFTSGGGTDRNIRYPEHAGTTSKTCMTATWENDGRATRCLPSISNTKNLNCYPPFFPEVDTMPSFRIHIEGIDELYIDYAILRPYADGGNNGENNPDPSRWKKVWDSRKSPGRVGRCFSQDQAENEYFFCDHDYCKCEAYHDIPFDIPPPTVCTSSSNCEANEICNEGTCATRIQFCVSTNGYFTPEVFRIAHPEHAGTQATTCVQATGVTSYGKLSLSSNSCLPGGITSTKNLNCYPPLLVDNVQNLKYIALTNSHSDALFVDYAVIRTYVEEQREGGSEGVVIKEFRPSGIRQGWCFGTHLPNSGYFCSGEVCNCFQKQNFNIRFDMFPPFTCTSHSDCQANERCYEGTCTTPWVQFCVSTNGYFGLTQINHPEHAGTQATTCVQVTWEKNDGRTSTSPSSCHPGGITNTKNLNCYPPIYVDDVKSYKYIALTNNHSDALFVNYAVIRTYVEGQGESVSEGKVIKEFRPSGTRQGWCFGLPQDPNLFCGGSACDCFTKQNYNF